MDLLVEDSRIAETLAEVDEVGYCVLPDILTGDEVAAARDALDRAAADDLAAGRAATYGPRRSNQRVWTLLNKGEVFVRMALHPLTLAIVRARLGPDVLLSNLCANITAPGGDEGIGRLHTDQGFLLKPSPVEIASNVVWMLDDFTEENGATVVIPGSHLSKADPVDLTPPANAKRLTGRAGSAAILDGRLHHCTGRNHTADQKRRGVFAAYYLPYLRTQENWTRSLDPRVLAAHPELSTIVGLEEWRTLGSIDGPRTTPLG